MQLVQQIVPWLTFILSIITLLVFSFKFGRLYQEIEQLKKDRDGNKAKIETLCTAQTEVKVFMARIDERLEAIQKDIAKIPEKS